MQTSCLALVSRSCTLKLNFTDQLRLWCELVRNILNNNIALENYENQ
jgi:hypothetical protein